MKFNAMIVTILFLAEISILSCNLFTEDEKSRVYYKSYFLGESYFPLEGKIYGSRGQNIFESSIGNNIIAKIYHLDSDWELKSSLNGNNFSFQIIKISDGGIVLSNDISSSHYMWDFFIAYFTHLSIPDEDPRGYIKIYSLSLELDDGSELIEYQSSKTLNDDEHFFYVFVTEPVDISGNFHWEDEYNDSYWYYDCNFSKAGWYKICNFFNHSVENNQDYFSSTGIKLRKIGR
jgi:hypothetical protein